MSGLTLAPGVTYWPGRLNAAEQKASIDEILDLAVRAPFYRPTMPGSGKPMSVEMTNLGALGWVTDREKGYRYEAAHPVTGRPWPPIPERLLAMWSELTAYKALPEACLVNLYRGAARMGLHRDADEAARDAPVLSLTLGDAGLFRFGGSARKGPTQSLKLASGDALVFGGPARLMYHGIDRILAGSSSLVPGGGRINLTLRRVNPPGRTGK